MKKYLTYFILILSPVLYTSCVDDGEEFDVVEVEGSFDFEAEQVNEVTELDEAQVNLILLGTSGDVEVFHNDVSLGTVSATSGAGTFTVNKTDLGLSGSGTETLRFIRSTTESVQTRDISVTFNSPISFELSAEEVIPNGVNDTISVTNATLSASITAFTFETKVGSGGTFATPAGFSADDVSGGMYVFQGQNFTRGDTVFYKATVTSGTLSAESMGSFVVGKYTFSKLIEGVGLSSGSTFDLINNREPEEAEDVADLQFTLGAGNQVGFTSASTMFVLSDTDTYDDADIVAIKAEYEDGTPTNAVADVEKDQVYIFKITRGAEEHFGILKVASVDRINANDEDNLVLEYKIGE